LKEPVGIHFLILSKKDDKSDAPKVSYLFPPPNPLFPKSAVSNEPPGENNFAFRYLYSTILIT
jgi:hypothetical protein